jgi:hypothetical protein
LLIYTPAPAELTLMLAPQLSSWDASTSASHQRLAGYLEHAEDLLAPVLATTRDPLALRLEVGLPADVDVLRERDLDNYLHPLVTPTHQAQRAPVRVRHRQQRTREPLSCRAGSGTTG